MDNSLETKISDAPIEDVTSSTWKYIRAHYVWHIIAYVCAFIAVIIFIPHPFVLIIMIFIGVSAYSGVYSKAKRQFTEEFGASIGFAYIPEADIDSISGKLFETGEDQRISDVLSGSYKSMPMRIFTLYFTVGSGKHSHTYTYTVFEATLAGSVPDILLYSKKQWSAVSDFLSGDETIELEGDFNEHFVLRVPKGYEQEAYQIFTPDVMADLIDRAADVSFEFVGNKLYMYAVKTITKKTELQAMFDLAEFLSGLFVKNTAALSFKPDNV
ncbi:MAG: hypothetical protein JWO73_147 [Candidatus Taylorbacteria bacterium]|nr:hypothetical protein [Candidatus Taylorbacteria bacterium]